MRRLLVSTPVLCRRAPARFSAQAEQSATGDFSRADLYRIYIRVVPSQAHTLLLHNIQVCWVGQVRKVQFDETQQSWEAGVGWREREGERARARERKVYKFQAYFDNSLDFQKV